MGFVARSRWLRSWVYAAGTVIMLNGYSGEGFAIIIGNVVLLAGAFITGRVLQYRERTRKAQLPIQITQR